MRGTRFLDSLQGSLAFRRRQVTVLATGLVDWARRPGCRPPRADAPGRSTRPTLARRARRPDAPRRVPTRGRCGRVHRRPPPPVGGLLRAGPYPRALAARRRPPDPDAGDACVLWCAAIRHAVLTAKLDLRRGLELVPPDRRPVWSARIAEAEAKVPADFTRNGWVVQALQGAWSAITTTPVPVASGGVEHQPGDHLRLALEAAVRGGRDANTVAAIAGLLRGGTSLRRRGSAQRSLLHCAAAQSWIPTIAAAYAVRHLGANGPRCWPR